MEGNQLGKDKPKPDLGIFAEKSATAELIRETLSLFETTLSLLEGGASSGTEAGGKYREWILICLRMGWIKELEVTLETFRDEDTGSLVVSNGYSDRDAVQGDLERVRAVLARANSFFTADVVCESTE
ncbi:MAG: hypothetical protein WCT28_03235 [Patescibacteria group bacterium]